MEPLWFHNTPALIFAMDLLSYISGFVDGEGCFCVPFCQSKRHRLGWDVRPSFSVSQNGNRAELLYVIQRQWECGFIRPDRSDQTLKYEVRSIGDLVANVLPHFERYPLQSSKQKDVEQFARICRLVQQKRHLDVDGLQQIVKLAMVMNPSGRRKFSESDILRSL